MSNQPHVIPRIAITSIATGLIMMAVFTTMWSTIAHFGFASRDHWAELILFGVLAAVFIANSIYFFSISKRFPKLSAEADKARGKKEGMWFGIIFGGEGLGIVIAVNIVTYLGHPDLVIPVIALVVALHFYPMAKIFKRTIDYYVATWSTIIAVCGIVFTLNKTFSPDDISVFIGIGMAMATSCYGLYMIYNGRRMIKKVALWETEAVAS